MQHEQKDSSSPPGTAHQAHDSTGPHGAEENTTAAWTALDTINAMGEGVVLLDVNGIVRNANPAFSRLADLEIGSIKGADIRNILPDIFDQDKTTVRETLARVRLKQPGHDATDALTVSTGRGERKWVVPTLSTIYRRDNKPDGMVLTLRDITPLIHAREELRASESKYRQLVESVNNIIMRLTADQRITFFNAYAQRFFGYSSDEILGRTLVGTILPEMDSEGRDLRKFAAQIIANPETHGASESEALCRNGRRVWIHWSNRAIRNIRGEPIGLLCVGTDITERKRLEQQAEVYRRRLRALAGELAATEESERRRVSSQIHDTVIQTLSLSNMRLGGIVKALKEAGFPETISRLQEARNLIRIGVSECRHLMAELTPPLLYEVGLEAALTDFAEKQEALYHIPISVETENETQSLSEAQRAFLFQCARELITNGLKHAGPCEIRVRLIRRQGHAVLEVRDTGDGFDSTTRDIFSTDDEGGFGLFNIRERLHGFGGQLDLLSVPGEGTTVRIRLPIDQQVADGETPA